MDKDLKQINHIKRSSRSSKKVAALSFLAAIETASCISGRRQGASGPSPVKYFDLSGIPEGSPKFNEVKNKTTDILSEQFAESNAKTAFFQAIKKCDFPLVKSLLKNRSITSKEVVKALRLALEYKDTLSFRYKHEKIVHFLLRNSNLAPTDLCAQDKLGRTLLHLVIERGDIDAVQFLVAKLPLEGLCAEDNKGRTPMHWIARCKSPTMFGILFDKLIDNLGQDEAVKTLFNETGYSVFACAYLSKHRELASLLNNSHVQMPIFLVQGYNMFKRIIKHVSGALTFDQLMTIANEIDDIESVGMLYSRYARALRSLIWPYLEKKAAESGAKISRLKFHKEQERKELERKKRDCIKRQQYGGEVEGDEGYGSGSESESPS